MSLFRELLLFRVYTYGTQSYRILILMYHMLASSIYSKHSCSQMIFPFDMTNEITTSVHQLLYQYFIVYSPPNDMRVLDRPSNCVLFVCNFRLSSFIYAAPLSVHSFMQLHVNGTN